MQLMNKMIFGGICAMAGAIAVTFALAKVGKDLVDQALENLMDEDDEEECPYESEGCRDTCHGCDNDNGCNADGDFCECRGYAACDTCDEHGDCNPFDCARFNPFSSGTERENGQEPNSEKAEPAQQE